MMTFRGIITMWLVTLLVIVSLAVGITIFLDGREIRYNTSPICKEHK